MTYNSIIGQLTNLRSIMLSACKHCAVSVFLFVALLVLKNSIWREVMRIIYYICFVIFAILYYSIMHYI